MNSGTLGEATLSVAPRIKGGEREGGGGGKRETKPFYPLLHPRVVAKECLRGGVSGKRQTVVREQSTRKERKRSISIINSMQKDYGGVEGSRGAAVDCWGGCRVSSAPWSRVRNHREGK